jgi:hypothetical protein
MAGYSGVNLDSKTKRFSKFLKGDRSSALGIGENMMSQHKLKFKKMSGKYDELEFWIGPKRLVQIQNPKQRIVPHDMVHYAVETMFPFEGFIELVFAGHEPGKIMEVLNGFSPKLSDEYSETSWITESLVESLQAALWSQTSSFDHFEYAYGKACEARKIEPATIKRHDFESCLTLVKELSDRWTNLEVGEVLELNFSSKSSISFNA